MITIMLEKIAEIFSKGKERALTKGELLFKNGDRVRSVYFVHSGTIELVRHSLNGARMVLATASANCVAAEASVYSSNYHCDGVALEDTVVQAVSIQSFKQRLAEDVQASEQWTAYLAHSVQRARMQAEVRNLHKVGDRLDAWLGSDGKLPAKGEWHSLADHLGVSKEALYRELAKRRK